MEGHYQQNLEIFQVGPSNRPRLPSPAGSRCCGCASGAPDCRGTGHPVTKYQQSEAVMAPSNEQLSSDGFLEVEDRTVPGPQGESGLSLLICRPTAAAGPHPVIDGILD